MPDKLADQFVAGALAGRGQPLADRTFGHLMHFLALRVEMRDSDDKAKKYFASLYAGGMVTAILQRDAKKLQYYFEQAPGGDLPPVALSDDVQHAVREELEPLCALSEEETKQKMNFMRESCAIFAIVGGISPGRLNDLVCLAQSRFPPQK